MVIPHGVTIASLVKPNLLKILNSRNKMWKGGSKITKKNNGHVENALTSVWNTRPMKETQKLIDRMPKIMHAIIEADWFKPPY